MKMCCCTGHRPKGFSWDYYDKTGREYRKYIRHLERVIKKTIKAGYGYFISGGALGVDMDFAEIVIKLRRIYPHIRLEIAIPCDGQNKKWREDDTGRYLEILAKADAVYQVSKGYTAFCMQKRNEYMVDKSEKVIAVWNGAQRGGTYNTIRYAELRNKEIEYIRLPSVSC